MHTISLRINNAIKDQLDKLAEKEDVNQSEIIRRALLAYVKEQKKDQVLPVVNDVTSVYGNQNNSSVNFPYNIGFGETSKAYELGKEYFGAFSSGKGTLSQKKSELVTQLIRTKKG
ncbi:MAG: CopG family transcriptional regulator [Bacteroidales bacterium]|nr:CopG family transcriptional regulator [Bacteroidales bacterium]